MTESTTWGASVMDTAPHTFSFGGTPIYNSTIFPNTTSTPEPGFCPGGWQGLCLNSIHPSGLKYFFEILLFVYSFAGLAIVCDDYLGKNCNSYELSV